MKISIAIMAHPKRVLEAERLHKLIKTMPFSYVSLIFDSQNDEWKNGETCLYQSFGSDWHIVIQDDAIISPLFYENVVKAIENIPSESLISFYTGRVRPYSFQVNRAVHKADERGASWLSAGTLFWGVCIAIPTKHIEGVLRFAQNRREAYDSRIGRYFMQNKLPVYYAYPSIADHDYTLGSLIGNDRTVEPRVAHRYEPGLITAWNKDVIPVEL